MQVKQWLVGDRCQWGKQPRGFETQTDYYIERFMHAAEIYDREGDRRFIVPVEQLYASPYGPNRVAAPTASGCTHPADKQSSVGKGTWCSFCGAMYFFGGGWNYPTVMPGY